MSNALRYNTVFSGAPDFKRAETAIKEYEEIYDSGEYAPITEYIQLSIFLQALFISDNGYVVDTGNFQTVNRKILSDILENVKKHPNLWKLFMVC